MFNKVDLPQPEGPTNPKIRLSQYDVDVTQHRRFRVGFVNRIDV